ncbi:MAG TPA: hypothetical protein VGJ32_09210 [Solirubrobacteraceae bacterium]|jgi:hypothetical protein
MRPLGRDEHELLELCAEGWSGPVIAALLGIERSELPARTRALCAALGVAPRPDGRPTVHAARLWLVGEAHAQATVAQAA